MFELGEDVKVRKARKCFRWSMREGGGDKVCARERERERQTDRELNRKRKTRGALF